MNTQNISITLPVWMIKRLDKFGNRSSFIQKCLAEALQTEVQEDTLPRTRAQIISDSSKAWRKAHPNPIPISEYIEAKNYGRK